MSQDLINEIAGKHLGKAGDGSAVNPYITPDQIDPSLMVAVPRHLNRTQYGIDESTKMYGYDVWHGYEFSTMLKNGYPLSAMMKWVYSAESKNIIESKSAKLYLNSYNMHRWDHSYLGEAANEIEQKFEDDFKRNIETSVDVYLHTEELRAPTAPFTVPFFKAERLVDLRSLKFVIFNEDPSILKSVAGGRMPLALTTNALRSNCRVTNQPDWGDVFVYIEGSKHITPESFLQYVVSMRKENHFHEEITECIYKRLLDLLNPEQLLVACLYTRRGGIDICPVRATSLNLIHDIASPLVDECVRTEKTMRQ